MSATPCRSPPFLMSLESFIDTLSYHHPYDSRFSALHDVLTCKDAEKLNAWLAELSQPHTLIHQLAKCAIRTALKFPPGETIRDLNSYLTCFPMDTAALWCRVQLIMSTVPSEMTLHIALSDLGIVNYYMPSFRQSISSAIGKIYFMLEKYTEALAQFQVAVNCNPSEFLFEETYLIAHLYTVYLNNPNTGIVYFDKILDQQVLSNKRKQAAFFGVSVVYAKQGHYAMSIALINSAIKLAPIRAQDEVIFLHWMLCFKICWCNMYVISPDEIALLLSALDTCAPRSKKMQSDLLMTKARFGPKALMYAYVEAANLVFPLKDEDKELLILLRTDNQDDTSSSCSVHLV